MKQCTYVHHVIVSNKNLAIGIYKTDVEELKEGVRLPFVIFVDSTERLTKNAFLRK